MVILGLTNTKAPVIIAVALGSILAPHGEVYGYKIIQEERCSVFRRVGMDTSMFTPHGKTVLL